MRLRVRNALFVLYIGRDWLNDWQAHVFFVWRPKPGLREGDMIRGAWGFWASWEWLPRPYVLRRVEPAWATNEHCSARWTGRDVEVLSWRWPAFARAV